MGDFAPAEVMLIILADRLSQHGCLVNHLAKCILPVSESLCLLAADLAVLLVIVHGEGEDDLALLVGSVEGDLAGGEED